MYDQGLVSESYKKKSIGKTSTKVPTSGSVTRDQPILQIVKFRKATPSPLPSFYFSFVHMMMERV